MTCIPTVGNPSFYGVCRSLVITDLVPLVTLGGSKDREMIIGAETFNDNRCEESSEIL